MHRKFRYLLTFIFLMPSVLMAQTNYYVSSSEGDDTNPGTSVEQAWQSLEKVNCFNASPGDQILFKRGDEWDGFINVKASGTSGNPIVYGAYGTGENPKIYGSKVITGWTLHSGNIWKATVSENIEQIFLDGERMKLARYPNTGYFDITSVGNTTQFTSTDLNGALNYTGASWIGRTTKYTMHTRNVTASSSQTLTIDSKVFGNPTVGEGFFLANKLIFLDSAGEWYYDPVGSILYFWTPNGDSPANYIVRGSALAYGVNASNRNYITIENLSILHSASTGVYGMGANYLTVNNCSILSPDVMGIYTGSCTNTTVTNNCITQANSNAIRLHSSPSSIVTDNIIDETGLHENINKVTNINADNMGTGIFVRGDDITINYNKILNSGYNGINFTGTNNMIKYNYINGACQVLDDGGGIYTYTGYDYSQPGAAGSEVMYNIVLNVFGNREGSESTTKDSGHGIYMDNNTHDVVIQNNTVAHVTNGIFLHQNGNTLVDKNTVMDGILLFLNSKMVETNTFTNNIVYPTARTGDYTWWQNTYQRIVHNELGGIATFNFNTYISPYAENGVFVNYSSFAEWQSTSGQDANSTFDGTALKAGETEKLFYNDSKQTKIFDLGDTIYRDLDGEQVKTTLTLEPFTSKILIKTNIND